MINSAVRMCLGAAENGLSVYLFVGRMQAEASVAEARLRSFGSIAFPYRYYRFSSFLGRRRNIEVSLFGSCYCRITHTF